MASSKQQIIAAMRDRMAAIESDSRQATRAGKRIDRAIDGLDSFDEAANRIGAADESPMQDRSLETLPRTKRRPNSFSKAIGDAPKDPSPDEPVDDADAAYKKVLKLCAVKEQASVALVQRLVRDGFSENAAHEAVQKARRFRIVDDARYADSFVRSQMAAGKGLRGIERSLEELGIDASDVEGFAQARLAGDEAEIERALVQLNRKPPRAKNAREAAYRKLVSKGFSSSVAASAARAWHESRCS